MAWAISIAFALIGVGLLLWHARREKYDPYRIRRHRK
jgi:nitrogen fixation-related uncharacterized protein